MRLSNEQIAALREVVRAIAGDDAEIVVFGSRLDNARHGGDLDLLIESDRPLGPLDRARIKIRLEDRLGLPVDVIVHTRGKPMTPFLRIALETGVAL